MSEDKIKRVTQAEVLALLDAQGVSNRLYQAAKCPMCKTVQSFQDLVNVGAGPDRKSVAKYFAFSCIGRWTNAPGPRRKPDGKPCNWTMGGLLKTGNTMAVLPDGEEMMIFDIATPEEAQAREVITKQEEADKKAKAAEAEANG